MALLVTNTTFLSNEKRFYFSLKWNHNIYIKVDILLRRSISNTWVTPSIKWSPRHRTPSQSNSHVSWLSTSFAYSLGEEMRILICLITNKKTLTPGLLWETNFPVVDGGDSEAEVIVKMITIWPVSSHGKVFTCPPPPLAAREITFTIRCTTRTP